MVLSGKSQVCLLKQFGIYSFDLSWIGDAQFFETRVDFPLHDEGHECVTRSITVIVFPLIALSPHMFLMLKAKLSH